MSLLSLKRSSSSIGRFLFLKSNTNISCSTQIISSILKSLLSKNILFVWLLKGKINYSHNTLFCSMVIESGFSFLVSDHTGQPYSKCE